MLKIIKNINTFLIVILLAFCILPSIIFAQKVSLISNKNIYNVGDSFLVKVKLDSQGKSINTLGGNILISKDFFDISDIQTGDSFISLWTERPKLENGQIIFSGGLPGGYSGSDGTIFSFVLKAKKQGDSEIEIQNFEAFLNDGKGSQIPSIRIISLPISINKNTLSQNEIYLSVKDTTPPEDFELSISSDKTVENNKYFLSFFAVDKGSGIARYEVEEDPWIISLFGYKKVWKQAENPQVLHYQKWVSTVKVRVIDMMGNVKEEKIIKPIYLGYLFYSSILIAIIFILFIIKKIKK